MKVMDAGDGKIAEIGDCAMAHGHAHASVVYPKYSCTAYGRYTAVPPMLEPRTACGTGYAYRTRAEAARGDARGCCRLSSVRDGPTSPSRPSSLEAS